MVKISNPSVVPLTLNCMLAPTDFPLVVPITAAEISGRSGFIPVTMETVESHLHGSVTPIVPQKRVMVASRGNPKLLRFAFDYAKTQHGEVFVVFIRYIAISVEPARASDIAADNEAQRLNQQAEQLAAEFGVPWRFLYATSSEIAETVLDIAATHAVDVLILGATRRGSLWRVMKGDIIQQVAEQLPESITLLIQA